MPEPHTQPNKANHSSRAGVTTAESLFPQWVHRLSGPNARIWAMIVGTSIAAALFIAPPSVSVYKVKVGDPAPQTIIATKAFCVFDDEATEKRREEALNSVLPSYDLDDGLVWDVQTRITSAFAFMRDFLKDEAAQEASQKERQKKRSPEARGNFLTRPQQFAAVPEDVTKTKFDTLLGTKISPCSFTTFRSYGFNSVVERDLRSLVVKVLEKGVVVSRDLVMRDGSQDILIRPTSGAKRDFLRSASTIMDLKEARAHIDSDENPEGGVTHQDRELTRALREVAKDLIHENITFNRQRTNERRQAALASVTRVSSTVQKGELVVRQGEPVTAEQEKRIAAFYNACSPYRQYVILSGLCLMLIISLRLCFHVSDQHLDRQDRSVMDILLLCILLLSTILVVRYMSFYAEMIGAAGGTMDGRFVLYAAPVAAGSMLTALLLDPRLAVLFAPLAALAACLSAQGDVYLFAVYFISSLGGLQGMSRVIDRASILRAGLVVGAANLLMIVGTRMALGQISEPADLYGSGLGLLGGVVSGLVVSGASPVLERLGYVTNVRLLEMANLNHRVLKDLSAMAPGTYHHSMVVGSLAEAAAESIGANPLLAKVGAYYHDIGKAAGTNDPLYFIENQKRGANPHDTMEPRQSARILISHVIQGVEKAKEVGLGGPIIDIIRQHHGTSVIKFFYHKALKDAEKDHSSVSEDEFRYPGPQPESKEAALVMLADVVEAACRTLQDPTPPRIEKRVQELVLGVFAEGQLDNSTLTLKDLHAITMSFIKSLQGVLHCRIDYPEKTPPHSK